MITVRDSEEIWIFVEAAPSQVVDLIGESASGCACVWVRTPDRAGIRAWVADPMPCAHRQVWSHTVHIGGVDYLAPTGENTVRYGPAIIEKPDGTFQQDTCPWYFSSKLIAESARALGIPAGDVVLFDEKEGGPVRICANMMHWEYERIIMRRWETLPYPRRSSIWRGAHRRAANLEVGLAIEGITRDHLEDYEQYVHEAGAAELEPERLLELAAEWFDTRKDRVNVRREEGDDEAAAELDQILGA